MMALSGVRKESALGGVGALGLGADLFQCGLAFFAPGDVAHHRHHLTFSCSLEGGLIERAAAHLNPDKGRGTFGC